jgi:hypothetical protein
MADRRLVVTDSDPASPDYGQLFALAPNTASAVGIPAFQFGPTKPLVGSELGEAFYETTTRRGWVWDGSGWREIAASPVISFASEAAMLLDVSKPVGTFAVTADTGQLFVRTATGWKLQGVKEYPTFAALEADTPVQGALGLVLNEGTLWERTATNWRSLSIRELADTTAVAAWTDAKTANVGDRVLELAHSVLYVRTSAGWRPASIWEETEANIQAATWPLDGQEAIATDTGRTFVRVNGAWQQSPINHYPTQAALLATTPTVDQMAWADDTGNAFTFSKTTGQWSVLNNGFDDPLPIGAIADFPTRTIPNGWLECDGSAIPAGAKYDALRTLLGTANLPDLRGLFSRAAKTGEGLLSKVNWTTGMPRTAFGTTNEGNHAHSFKRSTNNFSGDGKYRDGSLSTIDAAGGGVAVTGGIVSAGGHQHTITGGDAETAPDHARVVRCIKAFHITMAKPAPDQILTALVAPANGQALIFDAATNSWKNGSVPKITYSTTAPAAPSPGDLWYDSNNNRKLLNVWNGTGWLGTTGFGVNVAGSALQLPGYFNQDPSDTASPADTGGLSFRYAGAKTQLFLNKGSNWHAASPMLGDSANAGSTAVADAAGNMAWLSEPRFARSSADLGTAGEHLITLAKPATQMFEMWGFVMNASDFRAIPRMAVGGGGTADMWNFTSTSLNTRSQALTAYKDGGSHINDGTYFSTHQAGFNYKNETTLAAKGGYPITFTLKGTHMAANYWFFDLESKYLSQNNTPLVVTASWMSESLSGLGIFKIGVETRAWNSDTVVPSHHSINCRYL